MSEQPFAVIDHNGKPHQFYLVVAESPEQARDKVAALFSDGSRRRIEALPFNEWFDSNVIAYDCRLETIIN